MPDVTSLENTGSSVSKKGQLNPRFKVATMINSHVFAIIQKNRENSMEKKTVDSMKEKILESVEDKTTDSDSKLASETGYALYNPSDEQPPPSKHIDGHFG